MPQNPELQKIERFIFKHHILMLATSYADVPSACTLFYAYDADTASFIVASSDDTLHVKNTAKNPKIAGTIALETKIVGKIEGVQFRGEFLTCSDDELKGLYYKAFPYALAMKPDLWQIKVDYFKLTDNTLGFGKKIIWEAS